MACAGNNSKATGTNVCVFHPTEVYQRYCKTCDTLVCIECVLDKHKNHRCVKLIEILDLKRIEIKEYLKNLKRKEITELKSKLSAIRQRQDSYSSECLTVKTRISEHAGKLKWEIDNIRDEFIKRLEKKRKTDEKYLRDLEINLERELSDLESFIQDLSLKINNLQGVDVLTCIEKCKKSLMNSNKTDETVIKPPKFIHTDINSHELSKLFGDLEFETSGESTEHTKCTSISGERMSGSEYTGSSDGIFQLTRKQDGACLAEEEQRLSHEELAKTLMAESFNMDHEVSSDFDVSFERSRFKPSTEKESALCAKKKNIDIPKKRFASLVSKVNSPIKPTFLTVTKHGELWVSSCHGDLLKLKLNSHGTVTTLLKTKLSFTVNAIAVNDRGDLLISSPTDKKIVVLREKLQVEDLIFTQQFIPEGICVAQNGDVLVALNQYDLACSKSVGKIQRYSSKGKLIFSAQYDSNGKELFKYPFIIAENTNGDIWVIDLQISKVNVLNGKGKFRFAYSGNDMGTNWAPRGVTRNNKCQVLIADNENEMIHLVDPDGQFLDFVLTKEDGLCKPYSVTIDNGGRIYVGNVGNSKIQIFECIQDSI